MEYYENDWDMYWDIVEEMYSNLSEEEITSFGSYDVLMTEVANGFFYNGGGKITLK